MPRTYTASGVTLLGDGEESGVWGQLTNTNIQILDRMISQAGAITLSGTTHTLLISDGVLSDGQYGVLVFGGSPSGTNTVTISPNDAKRTFVVKNSSGESVVLTQGSGGNVTVLDGRTAIVYCDGAGSGAAVVNVSDALVASTLSDIGALTPTDGNFIVGNGSTWVTESGDTALASLGVTATTLELNKLSGVTWTLLDYNTLTSTAAELNKLSGVTWTLLDYNTLTATAAELNLLGGKTLSGSDTEIVTGTAGSDGDIVQWNADGDLVSYGAATQAEATWETGTATTESLVSPAKVKAAIDNNQTGNRYESGWVAATYPATFTHGLGQTPQFYQLQARAAVANGGYSIGDVVMLLPNADGDGARTRASYANSTQVVFPQAPIGGSPSGFLTGFTGSNWEIKVIALKELR